MTKAGKKHQALKVSVGIPQPGQVNVDAISRFKKNKKKLLRANDYFKGIRSGDRNILSQAITLNESSLPNHQKIATEVISLCLPYSGNSIRIGITGVPGVGKSTFIESFGSYLSSLGKKIAVLTIDPSSSRSKGSILGDKTRMELLSNDKNTFIRPSPSSGSLGGVARKTRESIHLCEAAGFDTIIVETVGVGQSETAVHSMVDFFLLLMLAGAGDELQGIKRGIMEMADLIAINKADGDNLKKAELAKLEYQNALHLFPAPDSGWIPESTLCSAIKNTGIVDIWEKIDQYKKQTSDSKYFFERRKEQSIFWMHESIRDNLLSHFYHSGKIPKLTEDLEKKVISEEISSSKAANNLLKLYFDKFQND